SRHLRHRRFDHPRLGGAPLLCDARDGAYMSSGIALALTLLFLTLIKSVPIVFAALGGVISERSGVGNIGLEGMMTAGAFSAVVFTNMTGSPIVGLLAGIVFGAFV